VHSGNDSAPDTGMNENLHLPLKASNELLLGRIELCNIVDLRPAALLLFRTVRKVLLVRQCRGELM
jgi:hypothetical protein